MENHDLKKLALLGICSAMLAAAIPLSAQGTDAMGDEVKTEESKMDACPSEDKGAAQDHVTPDRGAEDTSKDTSGSDSQSW